jgi:transposase
VIERAYRLGEALGLSVWNEDEAGPFQTLPYPGYQWQPEGRPARYSHEYIRNGTAKLLTLFHPATGEVRVKGVRSCTNAVLHPWLTEQLTEVVAGLPNAPAVLSQAEIRAVWEEWRQGLTRHITLPEHLPPVRLLLIVDNLAGHHTPSFMLWLFDHGILPLFIPLGGSHFNMAESIQRILTRRALDGQHPQTPEEIIDWLEATARGWNREPTPFAWGGKRRARRERAYHRRHALGGSGAWTPRPLARRWAA